ncbi:Hypothetical protein A7982_02471 [Minicystis rosea]|nr:Hypothetical protein A7982_02471 [Minicystis rosea]
MVAGAAILMLSACANTTTTNDVSDPALDPFESDAIYEMNRVREDAGVAAILTACTSLNVSATKHSDDMRDQDYLKEQGLDGSTIRTRSCAAGYQPGCVESTAMGELIAKGIDDGKTVVAQWSTNADAHALMVSPSLVAIGVGRSLGEDGTMWWTVDLGGQADPSCQ